jgi:hypothetical protein
MVKETAAQAAAEGNIDAVTPEGGESQSTNISISLPVALLMQLDDVVAKRRKARRAAAKPGTLPKASVSAVIQDALGDFLRS